ncbi:hypothetical protein [Micromonospora sp. Llam0]|uniref:hypothetical protein n=1 Tax=Micromonospora sp. Llam0 TaxID=2485143 RepID=UPI000F4623BC|nr:hypothetical protein [Micromonospora sp. Llam0]
MTGTPATPPYPRVAPCRHCGRPVLRDNDGRWIHADLAYACRDRWGGITATTAAPEGQLAEWRGHQPGGESAGERGRP